MMKLLRIGFAFLLLSASAAVAQVGQIGSGQVVGNPSAARAPATASSVTSILDRALSSSPGAMLYRGASAWSALVPTATARQMLQSGASGAPAWSTATWPATTTINQVLYSSAANVVGGVTSVNGGVLQTSATGVPQMTQNPRVGVAGGGTGSYQIAGTTSGVGTITVQAAAGTPTVTLGTSSGTPAVTATSPLVITTATGDIACSTCLTTSSFANPTASVGLTAVNGAATTAMRSDAAPALSQSISPIWTRPHQFQPSSGDALTINTAAASQALGFKLTQSGPLSGTLSSGFTYNSILVNGHSMNATSAGLFASAFTVVFGDGGTNEGGTLNAGMFLLAQNVATPANATKGDHIALQGQCTVNVNDGGTNTGAGAAGTCFGVIGVGQLLSGATFKKEVIGIESDVIINSTGSSQWRIGIGSISGGDTSGTVVDAAYEIGSTSHSFDSGFVLNDGHGAQAIATTGSLFTSNNSTNSGQSAVTIANIFNLPSLVVTGDYFNFANYRVTGAGAITGLSAALGGGGAITSSGAGGAMSTGAFTTVGTMATQNANAVAITGGTAAFTAASSVTLSQNASTVFTVSNTNGGGSATADLIVISNGGTFSIRNFGIGVAQFVYNGAQMSFAATNAAATMTFQTGASATTAVTLDASQGATFAAKVFAANLPTTTGALGAAICWTTTTGEFQRDTNAGGCLVSAREAKDIYGPLDQKEAFDIVMNLKPEVFRYKTGFGDGGKFEQIGFVADEVAKADERFAIRNGDGKYSGVRYMQITAALAGAIQQLKADNDNLRTEVEQIKRRASR